MENQQKKKSPLEYLIILILLVVFAVFGARIYHIFKGSLAKIQSGQSEQRGAKCPMKSGGVKLDSSQTPQQGPKQPVAK